MMGAVWILVIVLWQPMGKPAVIAHAVASQAACVKLLATFERGETAINENTLPPDHTGGDAWSASCELRVGGRRETA